MKCQDEKNKLKQGIKNSHNNLVESNFKSKMQTKNQLDKAFSEFKAASEN